MAYQMAYTDERLTEHAASVWLPMFVSFDHGSKNGRIVFNGYSSISALAASAPVIAQKAYDVSGEAYLGIVSSAVAPGSASVLDAVSQACYDYAATVADKDVDGEKVPFFADATEFALPTSPPPTPVSPPPPPGPPAPDEPEVVQVG